MNGHPCSVALPAVEEVQLRTFKNSRCADQTEDVALYLTRGVNCLCFQLFSPSYRKVVEQTRADLQLSKRNPLETPADGANAKHNHSLLSCVTRSSTPLCRFPAFTCFSFSKRGNF